MSTFRKQKRYVQKYRSKWEKVEEFKGWLKPLPGNITRAYCCYCHVIIKAHLCDLRKHGSAKKHLNASRLVRALKNLNEDDESLDTGSRDAKGLDNENSEDDNNESEEETGTYRWPSRAVECLIKHLKSYWKDFRDGLRKKKDIWEDISNAMSEDGFHISSYECGKKFRNIKLRYFSVLEKYLMGQVSNENIRIEYFNDLHELLSKDPETIAYLEQRKLNQKLEGVGDVSDEETIIVGDSGFDILSYDDMEWSEAATLLMLDFLLEFKDFFSEKENESDERAVWQTIAEQMNLEGHEVDEGQCRKKWSNLVEQYMRYKSIAESSGTLPLWPYFTRVRHVLNTVNIPTQISEEKKHPMRLHVKRGRGRGKKRTYSEQTADGEVDGEGDADGDSEGSRGEDSSPGRAGKDKGDDENSRATLRRMRSLSETASLWQRLNVLEARLDELSDQQEIQRHTNTLLSQILNELSTLSSNISPKGLADPIQVRDGITIVVPNSEQ